MKGMKKILIGATALCMFLASGCSLLGDDECKHEKSTKVEAVASTCISQGNIEHWVCDSCLKYFEDEACTKELTYEEIRFDFAPHTFGNGLYCEVEDCRQEKPYTTELTGHTYYVDTMNMFYAAENVTPEQNEAVWAVYNEYYFSAMAGTYYSFEADGVVNGKHFIWEESTSTMDEASFTGTYTTEGKTFTLSREDGGETYSITYTLNEYDQWVGAQDIEKERVAGLEGVQLQIYLQERGDHILRCKEGNGGPYTLGVCECCGGAEPRLVEGVGSKWKFTSAEYMYIDGVEKNAEVDAFVQDAFAEFLNTIYTLNDGGTVTATKGSAKDWVQYGRTIELDIRVGTDGENQPVYWRAVCRIDEDDENGFTLTAFYDFSETEEAGLPEGYDTFASAIITLTLVA